MSSSIFDNPHFWDPTWKRCLVVIIALTWVYMEWRANSYVLAGVGCLLAGLATYEFFLSGHYPKERDDNTSRPDLTH